MAGGGRVGGRLRVERLQQIPRHQTLKFRVSAESLVGGGCIGGAGGLGQRRFSQMPDLVHHPLPSKVHPKFSRQLLHQNVRHLQGAHHDAKILRCQHAGKVARNNLVP